jgi:hypothetical protein
MASLETTNETQGRGITKMMHLRGGTALAVVAGLLGLAVPSAQANWGSEGQCGPRAFTPNEHCYSVSRWWPNVHKNINQVWGFITADNVAFGNLYSRPPGEKEFNNQEMWVSWAEPGTIVEFPYSPSRPQWVEAGLQFDAGGCHLFYAYEYGAEAVYEGQGPSEGLSGCIGGVTHQEILFEKTPGTGEICVFADESKLACNPSNLLPAAPFTRLDAGTEIATWEPPKEIRGTIEPFATGGIDGRWAGALRHARDHFQPGATCAYEHGSEYGFIEYKAYCPNEPYESVGGEEEPLNAGLVPAAAAPQEEESSGPEGNAQPPSSGVDAFANYVAPQGAHMAESAVESKANETNAQIGDPEIGFIPPLSKIQVESVASTTLNNADLVAGERPLSTLAMSAQQKTFEEGPTYAVEMIGRFTHTSYARRRVDQPITSAYSHVNVVYNAINGEVLRQEFSNVDTPREEANKKALEKQLKNVHKAEAKNKVSCEALIFQNKRKAHCQSLEEECRVADERYEQTKQPYPASQICEQLREQDCFTKGRYCTPELRCRLGSTYYCEEDKRIWGGVEQCKQRKESFTCTLDLEEEYWAMREKTEWQVFQPSEPPKAGAMIAAIGRRPPTEEESAEERLALPPTIVPKVSAKGRFFPDPLVVITHRWQVVAKSHAERFALPRGVYRVTAKISGYKCLQELVELTHYQFVPVHCRRD